MLYNGDLLWKHSQVDLVKILRSFSAQLLAPVKLWWHSTQNLHSFSIQLYSWNSFTKKTQIWSNSAKCFRITIQFWYIPTVIFSQGIRIILVIHKALVAILCDLQKYRLSHCVKLIICSSFLDENILKGT